MEPALVHPQADPHGRKSTMPEGQLLITGDIGRDWAIRTTDLDAHARDPIDVHYLTDHCREIHHVQGVPLHHILNRVRLRINDHHKKDHLTFAVLAHADDGYQVLLSWAEIDPTLGDCAALLATRYNGQILTLPTLVLPRDARASRSVRRVRRVHILRVGDVM